MDKNKFIPVQLRHELLKKNQIIYLKAICNLSKNEYEIDNPFSRIVHLMHDL